MAWDKVLENTLQGMAPWEGRDGLMGTLLFLDSLISTELDVSAEMIISKTVNEKKTEAYTTTSFTHIFIVPICLHYCFFKIRLHIVTFKF